MQKGIGSLQDGQNDTLTPETYREMELYTYPDTHSETYPKTYTEARPKAYPDPNLFPRIPPLPQHAKIRVVSILPLVKD